MKQRPQVLGLGKLPHQGTHISAKKSEYFTEESSQGF